MSKAILVQVLTQTVLYYLQPRLNLGHCTCKCMESHMMPNKLCSVFDLYRVCFPVVSKNYL